MKAILSIPEKEIKIGLENFTYNQYYVIETRFSEIDVLKAVEKFAIGEPITLITSNMPDDLRKQIEIIIKDYCNH
jgi:hypothetical protein